MFPNFCVFANKESENRDFLHFKLLYYQMDSLNTLNTSKEYIKQTINRESIIIGI